MGDLPHHLDHGRHVALQRRAGEPWVRRAVLVVLLGVSVAALLNVFGQRQRTSLQSGTDATLRVRSPERVRGGLFFQARFDVVARRRLAHPRLLLGPGWAEELQLNTIEPSPEAESSEDGHLRLDYGPLDAGRRLTVWLQYEANPTGIGRRRQAVQLLDGDEVVAAIDRPFTVLP